MAINAHILIDCEGELKRFLRLVFDGGATGDGSLIVVLDREPKGRWDSKVGSFASDIPLKPFRITYHATGSVRFHGTSCPGRIFSGDARCKWPQGIYRYAIPRQRRSSRWSSLPR